MLALYVLPLRFHLKASQSIYFPPGKASNILRGGFGRSFRSIACAPDCHAPAACSHRNQCPYASIFEPRLENGPSGLADVPRPFLFRAPHLNGHRIEPNHSFHFDLHLFDLRPHITAYFISAFQQFVEAGIGPAKGHATLTAVSVLSPAKQPVSEIFAHGVLRANVPTPPVELPMASSESVIRSVSIRFQTPTELRKNQPTTEPPPFFAVIARLRDRISNLLTLYGCGKPNFDFVGLSERARSITLASANITNQSTTRYSGRHDGEHPIGGFLGTIEYAGDLTEFVPLLKAGEWTGVGRHTVWGNGQIEVWTR